MLTLNPMMIAPVCHVGDPLQLACSGSVEYIRWTMRRQDTGKMITDDEIAVIISIDEQQKNMEQIVVNSTTFTFMRTSSQGSLPLNTILSIDSIRFALNGVVVRCYDPFNLTVSVSTTIYIIEISK